MNILLTSWQSCSDYNGKIWISRLEKYGVDHSIVIELPSANGLDYADRNLVFLFKEPSKIADVTVIGYGGCYRFDDSTGGHFYTKVKEKIIEEQFSCAIEMWNADYLQQVAEAVFGFDEDRPLWKRKDALENFLMDNYSDFILK